jgi:hypothetical protein
MYSLWAVDTCTASEKGTHVQPVGRGHVYRLWARNTCTGPGKGRCTACGQGTFEVQVEKASGVTGWNITSGMAKRSTPTCTSFPSGNCPAPFPQPRSFSIPYLSQPTPAPKPTRVHPVLSRPFPRPPSAVHPHLIPPAANSPFLGLFTKTEMLDRSSLISLVRGSGLKNVESRLCISIATSKTGTLVLPQPLVLTPYCIFRTSTLVPPMKTELKWELWGTSSAPPNDHRA